MNKVKLKKHKNCTQKKDKIGEESKSNKICSVFSLKPTSSNQIQKKAKENFFSSGEVSIIPKNFILSIEPQNTTSAMKHFTDNVMVSMIPSSWFWHNSEEQLLDIPTICGMKSVTATSKIQQKELFFSKSTKDKKWNPNTLNF